MPEGVGRARELVPDTPAPAAPNAADDISLRGKTKKALASGSACESLLLPPSRKRLPARHQHQSEVSLFIRALEWIGVERFEDEVTQEVETRRYAGAEYR